MTLRTTSDLLTAGPPGALHLFITAMHVCLVTQQHAVTLSRVSVLCTPGAAAFTPTQTHPQFYYLSVVFFKGKRGELVLPRINSHGCQPRKQAEATVQDSREPRDRMQRAETTEERPGPVNWRSSRTICCLAVSSLVTTFHPGGKLLKTEGEQLKTASGSSRN